MQKRRVTRWHCDYCRRGFWKRSRAADHEVSCFKRPDRDSFLGELSSILATGKAVDFGEEPFGGNPPGCTWSEWVEHEDDEMPLWYPGPGKIWTGARWATVPGYRYDYPTGAHGYAGGPPPYDVWPTVDSSLPGEPGTSQVLLNELPAHVRVLYLDKLGIKGDTPCNESND